MTRLKEKILRLIRERGPLPVADYMKIALADPEFGYYRSRDPLGADFITAPEVSQIFGELIGLFFVQAWEDRGRAENFHLVEFGPGRGTLMADMVRAAKLRPAFTEAAEIILIETSPVLRAAQARALDGVSTRWLNDFSELDETAPLFAIANEFFDALPVEQFVKHGNGWRQRVVMADEDELRFGVARKTIAPERIPESFRDAPEASVFEKAIEGQRLMHGLAKRVARSGGVALIIDYGHTQSALGDTFQAVKAHRFADPLAAPGEADLTFHVDFAALAETARATGARVSGPVTQKDFLFSLGIAARAERLKRAAPDEAHDIDAAIERLTGDEQMGKLFKVMAVTDAASPALPC